ncbi:MAG: L-threonylcarbamoyladenylate synthase [Chitinophagaceae bacterium]|nr:L-threonylcarbamoyladenylate synthase [Chitinophagaceae bacterium]
MNTCICIKIHPQNPEEKKLEIVIDILRSGGIIIYPTDTIYGLGCDAWNKKAIDKILRIKQIKDTDLKFSLICSDLSHISDYTKPFDSTVFKAMKKCFPGPFTFILPANSIISKRLHIHKKNIGIRVPNNKIARMIAKLLGNPLMSTSLYDNVDTSEYITDPDIIMEKYQKLVDVVVDGGMGGQIPSTVLDATGNTIYVVRYGLGNVEDMY